MRPGSPKRTSVALALVLSAILLSQVIAIVGLAQRLPSAMATEGMAPYEKRFVEAKKGLPRSGIVGYLSDPRDGAEVADDLYARRYVTAQYNLAPLIVVDSAEPQLILGNFFSPSGMEKAMAQHKCSVLHDFRNGVFILRKEGP